MAVAVTRSFVTVPAGTIHVARSGEDGPAVLLFHQTPRSWDEYRDVLPLLGASFRAIAIDTIGFGDSSPAPWPPTIERWAETAVSVLDALGIERAHVVGHHTGATTAMEVAAAFPERVDRLVLSAPTYVDDAARSRAEDPPPVDGVDARLDGSHLVELWQLRAPHYPPSVELLERYMIDQLKAGWMAAEGHRVVYRYAMLDRAPLIRARTLVLAPTDDPFAYPDAAPVAALLADVSLVELEGAKVPAPDQLPEAFAAAVTAFLLS